LLQPADWRRDGRLDVPTMKRFLVASVLLLAAPLPACKPQKADKAAATGEVKAAVEALMATRRQRVLAALPAEDAPKVEGDDHPWLAWIKRVAMTPPTSDLDKIGVRAKGDQAELVQALSQWLTAQKDYYIEQKIEPNEYWTALSSARRVAKGTAVEPDAEFDALFFHANRMAQPSSWNLFGGSPEDDTVTNFFTYWKFIFDFKPKTGILEDEVNALCATRLAEFCKPIPMEARTYQIMKPYYEGYLKQIADYKGKYADSPYVPFLDRVAKVVEQRITKVPQWKEEPVLAEIRSSVPAPIGGNAVLAITDKGVSLMEKALRTPETGWKNDWAPDGKLVEEISKLVEDNRTSTGSPYNQSEIKVLTDPKVPVRYVEPLIRATIASEHGKEWPVAWLVGRRRLDGTNRRSGYFFTLLEKAKAVPFKVKSGGKTMACTAWGVIGKDPQEAKGFQNGVFFDGDKLHYGRLNPDGGFSVDQVIEQGPAAAEQLDTWADGLTTATVVAAPESATMGQWIGAMNGVAMDCTKGATGPGAGAAADTTDECKLMRNQAVFIATCK
jgi:hypothetical protein